MTTIVEHGDKLMLLPKAPEMRLPAERQPVYFTLPGHGRVRLDYEDAVALHHDVGQQLAFGMRWRPGPAPVSTGSV